MKVENILAKNITAAGDRANYDAACKRLLANKIILAWIMKGCLEEFQDFTVDEIAEKYIEGSPQIAQIAVNPDEGTDSKGEQIEGGKTEDSTMKEGTITYDIRFYALVPQSKETIKLILNVEAQNNFYPGYPIIKRGLYYCSRMISSQYGVEFTDGHYEKIRKTISIWICADPPRYRENTITRYAVQEENLVGNTTEKRENYDLITAVIVCLGNAGDDKYTGILKLLDVLLSSERKTDEKKRILQDDFNIKMTRELESEVLLMCNLSKGIEEKGIKEGIKEGILSSIQNLMESMDWSAEQAMTALKIPESEQVQYVNGLKK